MKTTIIYRMAIVLIFSISSNAFAAEDLSACDSKTKDGYVQIMKGTGKSARNPTLKQLFDAFNSSSTLHQDLKYEEGRTNQPRLYVEVPGKESVYYDFQSIPTKGPNDPRCKDKKITGYDCRLAQLKADEDLDGLTNGINTGVEIKVPLTDPELVARVSTALGCGEILEESGKPVMDSAPASQPSVKSREIRLEKTKPPKAVPRVTDQPAAEKATTNVVPAIQLQGAPKAPAANAPAQTAPAAKTQR